MYAELNEAWNAMTSPGQMFETRTVDLRGHPIKEFVHAPPNLREFWLASAGHGDRDYLVYDVDLRNSPVDSPGTTIGASLSVERALVGIFSGSVFLAANFFENFADTTPSLASAGLVSPDANFVLAMEPATISEPGALALVLAAAGVFSWVRRQP